MLLDIFSIGGNDQQWAQEGDLPHLHHPHMMMALSMIATVLLSTIFQISGIASLTKTRCQMS